MTIEHHFYLSLRSIFFIQPIIRWFLSADNPGRGENSTRFPIFISIDNNACAPVNLFAICAYTDRS